MPFISKDWRGPGEEWVRYQGGWEMKKCFLHNNDKSAIDTGSSLSRDREESLTETKGRSNVKRLLRLFERKLNPKEGMVVQSSPGGGGNGTLKRAHSLDDDYEDVEERECKSATKSIKEASSFPPFYPIIIKCTKEIAGFNELSEALFRLDFPEALRDVRRFNYVSKVIHLLLRHDKLKSLSGGAQKILFRMLEEMADVVYETNSNEHILRALLDELHSTIAIYHVWGSHLGSSTLFKQHVERRRKITEFVEKMQIKYKQDLALCTQERPGLVQVLPEECIREVLLRLQDRGDLERVSKTCIVMESIVKEKRIWREFVQASFTKQQIEFVLSQTPSLKENKNWKGLYEKLKKSFLPKESFSELIMLCRNCCSLFWQSLGHVCLTDTQDASDFVPITPVTFLSFFSV